MIRLRLLNCILALVCISPAMQLLGLDEISSSVAKIETRKRSINFTAPWRKAATGNSRGTGVLIGPRRVLTNAHVVTQATEITVQFGDSAKKLDAKLVAIAHDIDLAVLELEDDPSLASIEPLKISEKLPEIKSKVQVYGYPVGGEAVSITEGIVSRIEYVELGPNVHGLRIQVDAAINPGNSGGPAIVDGMICGINRAKLSSADNIGYLVPAPEIQQFLSDIDDGTYDGKPLLFRRGQSLENADMRRRFGLADNQQGFLIRQLYVDDPQFPIQPNDVLLTLGQFSVSSSGKVVDNGHQFGWQYAISKVAKEGRIEATILREGQPLTVSVPLASKPRLVLDRLGERTPKYFVYGPIVFAEATSDVLNSLDQMILANNNAVSRQSAFAMRMLLESRESPLVTRRFDLRKFDDEELVMVSSPLLPHKISRGLTASPNGVLSKVNGTPVRNMAHLVELLRGLESPFVEFEFAEKGSELICFDRQKLLAAMPEIMEEHGIISPGSADLMSVWNAK